MNGSSILGKNRFVLVGLKELKDDAVKMLCIGDSHSKLNEADNDLPWFASEYRTAIVYDSKKCVAKTCFGDSVHLIKKALEKRGFTLRVN